MCCGIGSPDKSGTHEQLNIMILGVLATWRRRGIGTQLLHRILTKLEQYPSVGEVYLHVQTSNDEAIRFYQVRRVHAVICSLSIPQVCSRCCIKHS